MDGAPAPGAPRPSTRPVVSCVVVAVICVIGACRAEAAVDDYLGKPIASVRLLIEGRDTTDTSLTRVIETHVGEPLSMPAVRQSITHLYSLNRFDNVEIDASAMDGGRIALRYELSPVHPVTRIEFTGKLGAPGVDTGQLRKVVVDRYGPSPPLGRNAELTQLVADALGERGYLHPEIEPHAIISHDPHTATLVFMVDPGPRTVIGEIDVAATPAVQPAEVIRRLGLASGAAYERRDIDARIERYLVDRRKAGYYEARLTVTPRLSNSDRTANLTLTLTQGLLVRVVFTGDPLPANVRAELVPIESEGSVDEDLLEDSTNRIQDSLRAQGYRNAMAPHERRQTDSELLITFDVKRGPAYRVSRLEISGNPSVPLSDFEMLLRLRDGQPFSEAKLDADVTTIENLYHRRGFASARAQTAEDAERVAGSDGTMGLIVRIAVSEGPRTLVSDVHVQGNTARPEETLTKDLGLRAGRPYSDTQLVLDRDVIQQQYANLGYLNASVEANPNFNADRTRAEPLFIVHEGPRIVVDHVLIVGNVRTSPGTIERELQIKPGDPLSVEGRLDSQRRLMALGLFRRVQVSDLRTGDETSRDLIVTVEESPATTVAYGGGVEGRVRVVRIEENSGLASEQLEFAPRGSFEIGRRNFFGKNRSANLFTSISLHPKDSPFFAGQSNADTDSTGFGFTEYRVLGQFREPKLFGTSADALITGTLEQQIRSSFNFARRGASSEIARKLTRHISGSISYQIQKVRVFDVNILETDRRLIDRLFPQVRLSSVSTSVIVNTLDDLIEPASGHYVSGNIQLAGRNIGSEVGFAKTYVRGQMFRTLPRVRRIVLAGNVQLGLASGFPREAVDEQGNPTTIDDLPVSERFFAGGDTTVRGFALDSVGIPGQTLDQDGFPIGGNAMVIFKTEVRAPVRGGFGVVGFFDSGNVFAKVTDIDLGELRSAVGFGFRYKSPVGPIRLDLGFKIHPQVIAGRREGLTALHVSFGQAF